MESAVQPSSRLRPSLRERERVARRLRRACQDERISLDTFIARVDVVYAARTRPELVALVADLRRRWSIGPTLLRATSSLAYWWDGVRWAWRRPRTPTLALPLHELITLGRGRQCGCVLSDTSVSRRHASIRTADGRWWLRDLGSMNGTYVNGSRILDEVEVRPGDEVWFGAASFRLAAPVG